jgi:hypothetical protein
MFLNYYFTTYLNKLDRAPYEYYFSNALSLYLNIVIIIKLNIFNIRRKKFGRTTTIGIGLGRGLSKVNPVTIL